MVRVLPRLCCVTQDVEAHAQDTAPTPLEMQGLQVFERAYSCCFPRVLRLLLMSCLRVVRQVNTGMWRSLVARVVRDDEVAGSNPVIPTKKFLSEPYVSERNFYIIFTYFILTFHSCFT